MKRMKIVLLCSGSLFLAGCGVNPSVSGNDVAGIGGLAVPEKRGQPMAGLKPSSGQAGGPVTTGAIVPADAEGVVVDLPDSSARTRGTQSGSPGEQVQLSVSARKQEDAGQAAGSHSGDDTDDMSEEERHRQELINRGDLPPDAPLPVQ